MRIFDGVFCVQTSAISCWYGVYGPHGNTSNKKLQAMPTEWHSRAKIWKLIKRIWTAGIVGGNWKSSGLAPTLFLLRMGAKYRCKVNIAAVRVLCCFQKNDRFVWIIQRELFYRHFHTRRWEMHFRTGLGGTATNHGSLTAICARFQIKVCE